jgi:hypothetical protein
MNYNIMILLLIIVLIFTKLIIGLNNIEHFHIDVTDLTNYEKTSVPYNEYDINKLIHVMFPCSMEYGYASYNSPSQNGISNCAIINCPSIDKYNFDNITCWKCCNYD